MHFETEREREVKGRGRGKKGENNINWKNGRVMIKRTKQGSDGKGKR